MKDLVLEALLDHARRRLAGAESGNARLPRVIGGDPIDLGVDDIGGNFHAHVLARFVDVSEFCLHAIGDLPNWRVGEYPNSPAHQLPNSELVAKAAKGGTRTLMAVNHRILSPARLPVPPLSRDTDRTDSTPVAGQGASWRISMWRRARPTTRCRVRWRGARSPRRRAAATDRPAAQTPPGWNRRGPRRRCRPRRGPIGSAGSRYRR